GEDRDCSSYRHACSPDEVPRHGTRRGIVVADGSDERMRGRAEPMPPPAPRGLRTALTRMELRALRQPFSVLAGSTRAARHAGSSAATAAAASRIAAAPANVIGSSAPTPYSTERSRPVA